MISLEMSLRGFSIKFVSVFLVIALFYVTRTAISIFKDLLSFEESNWTSAKKDYVHSLQSLMGYVSWSVYIIISLYLLGISLTSLTVIAGGLSVGIGFGMQNIISNFVSGLVLLFGRSIREGDVLQFDDIWCTVKKISFRSTIVETFDNAVLIIPNSELITTRILNWTSNNMVVRRDVKVGVAYGSDTELVLKTLLEVATEHKRVLKAPKPTVIFDAFGASSLDFILRIWIDSIDNSISTMSDLHYAIDSKFREKGIEIAFPQLDVHHKNSAVGMEPGKFPE